MEIARCASIQVPLRPGAERLLTLRFGRLRQATQFISAPLGDQIITCSAATKWRRRGRRRRRRRRS
eukprot:3470631-Pyramimonas_sp.AAC.1